MTVDSTSGNAYPWEASAGAGLGTVNTRNGNKLTVDHLVDWKIIGGQVLDFTLYHNSESSIDGELGAGWSWTYDVYLANGSGNPVVHWGNGLCVPFTLSGGTYSAPAGVYDRLAKNADGSWTITQKDGTVYALDASGFLNRVTDRNGYSITLTLNAQHYVTRIADPSGRYLDISVNNGKFETITDDEGRIWRFVYYLGHLEQVTWPTLGAGIGHGDVFYYNSGNDITSQSNHLGFGPWTSTYNANGAVVTETDPLSHTTTYSYQTGYTDVTDPLGHVARDSFDAQGMLASSTDASGYAEYYVTRDVNKNVTSLLDKRGKTWSFTYDARGNILTSTDPLSHTRTQTYNGYSELLTATDHLLRTTSYSYDSSGNMLKATNALGKTVMTNRYDTGLLLESADGLGRDTTYNYDPHGLLASVADPTHLVTYYHYDSRSRLESVEASPNHVEQIIYNAWDQPCALVHGADGSQIELVWEGWMGGGNRLSVDDEDGNVSYFSYDNAGHLTKKINGRGDQEICGYDAAGRLTSVTNGRGKVRTYSYTDRGDLQAINHADGTMESWLFDGTGKATSYTNGLLQTIYYSYDDAGRLVGKDYPSGTDVGFTYDAADRMTRMTDASGTTSWAFDAAGRVTTETTPQVVASYTFDDADQIKTRTETGTGTLTYGYDDAGRPTTVTNIYGEVTIDGYDTAGRLKMRTFATGASDAFAYDSRDRLQAITRRNSAGTQYSADLYEYDLVGNLKKKTIDGVATSYGYDYACQLVSENRTGYAASYTYDANGNRLTKSLNGTTETYSYDDGDKLLAITGGGNPRTFTYDGCGRTKTATGSGGVTTYSWDYEDQMVGVLYPNASTNTATYNGIGARAQLVDGGGTWSFRRAGTDVTDPVTNDLAGRYTPGISYHSSGTLKELHPDLLGTYGLVTDASQNVALTRTFDAFGGQLSSVGTASLYQGWGGAWGYYRQRDNSLLLVGHRFYDPSTGRFLTRDPSMDGRNWYVYCDNSPLTKVDPTGYDGWDDAGNFFGGWGQSLTFGATGALSQWINNELGYGDFNYGGAYFTAGQVVGAANGIAIGSAGGLKATRALQALHTTSIARQAVTTWQEAEALLATTYGGQSQFRFAVNGITRVVDQFAGGIAREAKFGYVTMRPSIMRQIQADRALVQSGRISGATWHFFSSPKTGIGASSSVIMELRNAGINIIYH